MLKSLFKEMPLWFCIIWVVALITVLSGLFYMDLMLNMLALGIFNIANGVRIWRDKRLSAIAVLILGIVCTLIFVLNYFKLFK
ncbi:hypothetical protein ABE099_16645 [Paenibacillus turicensis]|uniref:hypothetical protein n=1 Tax=Paenibacillus turicensis TaxID=160487 RepID=UPI003D2806ED